MEDVLLSSVKGRNVSLSSLVNGHLDNELLEGHLNSLPTILGLYNAECKNKIKSVTHVSRLAEVFNTMPAEKIQCSEVHKMLKLYYTIPLTSATCERSFSTMRRLKTWLWANTVANLLNDIMFANIQKAQMDDLNITAVAQEVANKNEERKNYFGSFTE